jgi:hypothetical protein
MAGYYVAGHRGLRWTALGWIAETLVQEAFFHAPAGELNDAYSSEVRTDLLSRLGPALIMLAVDALIEWRETP